MKKILNIFLILSIFILYNEISNISCQEQNLFQNMINNYILDTNYETSLIITEQIQKIFNIKNESFSIPIYVSIIDLTHANLLNISNDRNTYLNNYNNLLGVSDRVIFDKKKKTKENKLIKVFLNNTVVIRNNSYLDDMIIKKIIFEKSEYNLELYFLKNRYMSQYQSINKDNQKLFKFYDLNIIFFNDHNSLYQGIENNSLVILKQINSNLTESDIIEVIHNFIEKYMNNSIPKKLENKINCWIKIKNTFNDLIKLKHCNINLQNFLLNYEINQIKEKIEKIEKNLIPLLFSDKNINANFIDFNNSIKELKQYLEKYNINENDSKIDFYFSFISLVAIIIIIILLYKIYKEFVNAFHKKIK